MYLYMYIFIYVIIFKGGYYYGGGKGLDYVLFQIRTVL